MTVTRMLREMSSAEFAEWEAYLLDGQWRATSELTEAQRTAESLRSQGGY